MAQILVVSSNLHPRQTVLSALSMLAHNSRLRLGLRFRTRRVTGRLDANQSTSHSRRVHTRSPRVVIGIRREDPHRIWERRCPLTPEAVERLVHEDGFDVLVQPCERRVFKNEEFVKVRTFASLLPRHTVTEIFL